MTTPSLAGMTSARTFVDQTGAAGGARPRVPTVLRLSPVEEDRHHWYEESDIGRHLPQIIGAAPQADHVAGWS